MKGCWDPVDCVDRVHWWVEEHTEGSRIGRNYPVITSLIGCVKWLGDWSSGVEMSVLSDGISGVG